MLSPVAAACRWSLLLLSPLLSTRRRPPGSKPTRTLQGMARARSGQAPAWPLVSGRSVRRGSRVKRDLACTCARHYFTCTRCPAVTVTLGAGGAPAAMPTHISSIKRSRPPKHRSATRAAARSPRHLTAWPSSVGRAAWPCSVGRAAWPSCASRVSWRTNHPVTPKKPAVTTTILTQPVGWMGFISTVRSNASAAPMRQAPTTIEPSPPRKVIANERCSSRVGTRHGSFSSTARMLQPGAERRLGDLTPHVKR